VFPVVLVFLGVTIVHGARLIPFGSHVVLPVIIAVVIVAQMREFSRDVNALDSTEELRFGEIGRYIADALPRDAVVFAVMHSGSVNFYSGRVTVRFDWLPAGQFTAVAREFQRRGHPVFILLDPFEKEDFATRFGPVDSLATLDLRAAALVPNVALYRVKEATSAP
jgi:hypothetical protein